MAGNLAGVSAEERLWRQVQKTDGCWNWTGCVTGGYGRIRVGDERVQAHRYSYELSGGTIPDGFHLDHLCRNQLCVRPDHLEPVTPRENILRGLSPMAMQAKQTHCKRGHELFGENLRLRPNGKRECKACARIVKRDWVSRNRDRVNDLKRAAYRRSLEKVGG